MKIFCIALALLFLFGCERKPTIVGLFGEEIGEKIQPERCEKPNIPSGGFDFYASMAKVKNPKVAFPITESRGVTVNYSVSTNAEGEIECLMFGSHVTKRDAVKKWQREIDAIRNDARQKYGEPNYTGTFQGYDYESEVEGWYIRGRIFNITLSKHEYNGNSYFGVNATTYDQSARVEAEYYAKNPGGIFRKQWDGMKEKLPSDFVKLVEREIKARDISDKRPSCL